MVALLPAFPLPRSGLAPRRSDETGRCPTCQRPATKTFAPFCGERMLVALGERHLQVNDSGDKVVADWALHVRRFHAFQMRLPLTHVQHTRLKRMRGTGLS